MADAVKEDRANEGVLVDTAEEGGAGEVEGSTGRDGVDIAGLIVGTAILSVISVGSETTTCV